MLLIVNIYSIAARRYCFSGVLLGLNHTYFKYVANLKARRECLKAQVCKNVLQFLHLLFAFFGKTTYICTMKYVELLAPARDAEVGIEAFSHGADAVYIGSPRFGARAAAGNSIADIERLARYGHQYGGRTMVALNTILTDAELEEARCMAWQLYEAGVDAFIVQDLGLFGLDMPPVELHASTQCDNRTPEKVRLMRDLGASRVVLARELSVPEIAAIHEAVPDVELECFVHGALCVCLSGQCYLSASIHGRSANRGECAQPCRLPMDLYDAQGNRLIRQKHLLSLCDMNRSDHLEQLLEAGVTSLKIEGRLKDMGYVKNVVAYYRQRLDALLDRHSDWRNVSYGRCTYTFDPNPSKSFNRGFTDYFAEGERRVMWNHDSPKSMGEEVGVIAALGRDFLEYRSSKPGIVLHNGDGMVANRNIGFRANRVEGNRIFPLNAQEVLPLLKPGMELRRNLDLAFDQLLQRPSAKRKMEATMIFAPGRSLMMSAAGLAVEVAMNGNYEAALKPQSEAYHRQLAKLGDTPFVLTDFQVEGTDDLYIAGSVLNQLRRDASDLLTQAIICRSMEVRHSGWHEDCRKRVLKVEKSGVLPTTYLGNYHNATARKIAEKILDEKVEQSFESKPRKGCTVMQTRYCLKQALGQCPKHPLPPDEQRRAERLLGGKRLGAQTHLRIGDEKFILKFGCNNLCVSELLTIFAAD